MYVCMYVCMYDCMHVLIYLFIRGSLYYSVSISDYKVSISTRKIGK
jgi:hypothetical protein